MRPDPRVVSGLRAQLDLRGKLLDSGAHRVGWKIGFNTPVAQERLALDAPVVGFITSATVLALDQPCPVAGTENPVAEAEVAIRVGPGGSVAALGPAIEVVDLDRPLDDLQELIGRNIFHRAVVFGPASDGASLASVTARVLVNGDEHETVDAFAATGEPADVLAHAAAVLALAGEELADGDVVIAGAMSLVAPRPGDRMRLELGPLGDVELPFT
jgi:2-keto-4-pentenoate hydratase